MLTEYGSQSKGKQELTEIIKCTSETHEIYLNETAVSNSRSRSNHIPLTHYKILLQQHY